jgi:hypothetical protein
MIELSGVRSSWLTMRRKSRRALADGPSRRSAGTAGAAGVFACALFGMASGLLA